MPSPRQSSNTMFYVSGVMAMVLVVISMVMNRQQAAEEYTEQDLIQEMKQKLPEVEAQAAVAEFSDDLMDARLNSQLTRVAQTLQGAIGECVDKWPGHPASTKVRIVSDPAGRLVSLAVQGAPETAETCLITILSRGQYTRNADGVALLWLDRDPAHVSEQYQDGSLPEGFTIPSEEDSE